MYGKHSAAGSLVSFYAFMLMSVPMLHFIQNTVSKSMDSGDMDFTFLWECDRTGHREYLVCGSF